MQKKQAHKLDRNPGVHKREDVSVVNIIGGGGVDSTDAGGVDGGSMGAVDERPQRTSTTQIATRVGTDRLALVGTSQAIP